MSEKLRIGKDELIRRVFREEDKLPPQDIPEGRKLTHEAHVLAIVATASALGYEVTEEPALPERLLLGHGRLREGMGEERRLCDSPGDRTFGWLWVSAAFPDGYAELLRRYNARAAVLAVAEELERSGLLPAFAASRLRAAYGDPAP